MVLKEEGRGSFLLKKNFVYPLTRIFGLSFIEAQLKSGQWKAFTKKEMIRELVTAGFYNVQFEPVYAGSGWLATGDKRKSEND